MADDASAEGAFDWELNRENIQPLRRGRHASALSGAGVPISNSKRLALAEERMSQTLAAFGDENEKGAGDGPVAEASNDPLAEVLSFIAWFDSHFLIGKQKLLYEFLWKCINKLTKMGDVYDDDERILKVWTKLAETSLGNAINIFEHAHSIGSLRRCAQFYIEWSMASEARGAIEEARKCLDRGRRAGAVPVTALNEAADELEMRVLRKTIQDREAESDDDIPYEDDVDIENETREAFTRIAPLPDSTAPVVRIASTSGAEGSARLPSAKKPAGKAKGGNAAFEIFADDETAGPSWLKEVYEVRTYVEHIDLADENSRRLVKAALPPSVHKPTAAFTIWEEGQEEEPVKKPKARLMLRKQCIREMSIEESRLERVAADFPSVPALPSPSACQINRPKNLNLSRADIKPLTFDFDE